MKKILFVGMANSHHTAGWVNLLEKSGYEIYIFCPYPTFAHENFWKSKNFGLFSLAPPAKDAVNYIYFHPFKPLFAYSPLRNIRSLYFGFLCMLNHKFPMQALWAFFLKIAIKRIKPDIIHSLEFQHCGYLCLEVKKKMGASFPTWGATNWGSDIYLFGKKKAHKKRIQEMLSQIDFYGCESHRDRNLAIKLGLEKNKVLFDSIPGNGGFDVNDKKYRANTPPSKRTIILVKGYQNFAGRALNALKALEKCDPKLLHRFEIIVYAAAPEVFEKAKAMNLPIKCLPHCPHATVLALMSKARLHLAISISDGLSIGGMEAMLLGAFPIQTNTATYGEFMQDGEQVFLVPVQKIGYIAEKITRALTDDKLVDSAADKNRTLINKLMNKNDIKSCVIKLYDSLFNESP